MVVSSGSALLAPSVKMLPVTPPNSRQAFGRCKPMLAKLNEIGMPASDRVHLREIVVIFGTYWRLGRSRGISPDRLPFSGGVDISAAIPLSALQGRNHGD
jgi:hypothetical protein